MTKLFEGQPPHDPDAERAVLSAVLVDSRAWARIDDFLWLCHFNDERHRLIYEACADLYRHGKTVDAVTVASWLRGRDRLDQAGGSPYVAELFNMPGATEHAWDYARIVYDKWRLRELTETCGRIAHDACTSAGDVKSLLDSAEQAIYEIARTREAHSVHPLCELTRTFLGHIDEANGGIFPVAAVPTGFELYDRLSGGLHDGEVTVIAGAPGMGTTSFALSLAVNAAARPRPNRKKALNAYTSDAKPVGVIVISLELPKEQIVSRVLCAEARVDSARLRTGLITPADRRNLAQASATLAATSLWIDDGSAQSSLEIRAKVRRLQAEFDRFDPEMPSVRTQRLGLVVIDGLHFVRGDNVERDMKRLATELGLPIVLCAQLPSLAGRLRPQYADLLEAGIAARYVDNICFLHRDGYHNASADPAVAELILCRQRSGSVGMVPVRWDASFMRFDNLGEAERDAT